MFKMAMNFKKNARSLILTKHAAFKMKFYKLSESRVRKIFRAADRVEYGIAPKTFALMQRTGKDKRIHEIWLMCQKNKNGQVKIISVWRYPGKSPVGQVPIDEEVDDLLKSK